MPVKPSYKRDLECMMRGTFNLNSSIASDSVRSNTRPRSRHGPSTHFRTCSRVSHQNVNEFPSISVAETVNISKTPSKEDQKHK